MRRGACRVPSGKADNYDEIYANADYITLHVPSTPDTKGMINAETIAKMKDGVRIINLATGTWSIPPQLRMRSRRARSPAM